MVPLICCFNNGILQQAVEISTEIKESVDTAVKEAVPSQVPEMALASSKQPETQESAVLGETASGKSTKDHLRIVAN